MSLVSRLGSSIDGREDKLLSATARGRVNVAVGASGRVCKTDSRIFHVASHRVLVGGGGGVWTLAVRGQVVVVVVFLPGRSSEAVVAAESLNYF